MTRTQALRMAKANKRRKIEAKLRRQVRGAFKHAIGL